MVSIGRYIRQGILAALLSAALLGLAPIFGKLALREGMDLAFLVVMRTGLSAAGMWIGFALFARRYLYIYPVGLVACAIAGFINGLGSLMFYGSLALIDASLAQLLYATNPLMLAILLRLDGQPLSLLTGLRLLLALPAIYLLTFTNNPAPSQITGMVLMLGGAFMYALHLAVNQRTLRDMPAPTVTLYTITAMSVTVLPALFWLRTPPAEYSTVAQQGLVGLTLVTIFSRLTLFIGVKRLGGVQAALLGLSELIVSVIMAIILLKESLAITQWIGAVLLMASVALVGWERNLSAPHVSDGWLAWFFGMLEPATDFGPATTQISGSGVVFSRPSAHLPPSDGSAAPVDNRPEAARPSFQAEGSSRPISED